VSIYPYWGITPVWSLVVTEEEKQACAQRLRDKTAAEKLEHHRKWKQKHRAAHGKVIDAVHRAVNREDRLVRQRVRYAANPDYYRNRYYVNTYGITLEERNAMLENQGGSCAICCATKHGGVGWHLDHCHTTGTVRKILCHRCNTAIGMFNDDAELLRAAAAYLEECNPMR
jgi:hypothetical protein